VLVAGDVQMAHFRYPHQSDAIRRNHLISWNASNGCRRIHNLHVFLWSPLPNATPPIMEKSSGKRGYNWKAE
jgi:hypothetical protein